MASPYVSKSENFSFPAKKLNFSPAPQEFEFLAQFQRPDAKNLYHLMYHRALSHDPKRELLSTRSLLDLYPNVGNI